MQERIIDHYNNLECTLVKLTLKAKVVDVEAKREYYTSLKTYTESNWYTLWIADEKVQKNYTRKVDKFTWSAAVND